MNFITATKVDAKVSKWLLDNDILDCEGVASLAANESLVVANIIEPLHSNGITEAKKPGNQVAITKLWRKCRAHLEEAEVKAKALLTSAAAKAEMPHSEDQEIPIVEAMTISAAWEAKHGFTLTDSQILTPVQQGKLWREFSMFPKAVSFMDARQMRTRAMINMPKGNLVAINPGGLLERVEIIADSVEKGFDLWTRLRAYLYTLSYISISEPKWFPFQAAMQVSEQLLVFITDTYKGHSPDMDSLVGSWGATSLYISETTRIQKATPNIVFTDVGRWQHKWAWVPPPALAAKADEPTAGRPTPPQHQADSPQLQNKLDSLSGQVKRLQALADQQAAKLQARANSGGGGRGSGGGNNYWSDVRDTTDWSRVGKWGKGQTKKGGKGGGKQAIGKTQSGQKRKRRNGSNY